MRQLCEIFGPWLPTTKLSPTANGVNSRQRTYPLPLTFWAFLSQVLSPGSSCREIVRKVQAWYAPQAKTPDSGTSAYCQARHRLPLACLMDLHQTLAHKLSARITTPELWLGRCVKVVDGTGVSMPDTAANQQAWPQPAGQKSGCGFPVVKLVACFCLASGALLHWVEGTLKEHDCRRLQKLLSVFKKGEIVLADRGFSSYASLATLWVRGVDSVMRVHHFRKLDWRTGQRLGRRDRRVTWQKGLLQGKLWTAEQWAQLPAEITVRLVEIVVVVTRRGATPRAPRIRISRISRQDIAIQLYTSGTTGKPKGAMLSHANFFNLVETGREQKPDWNIWSADDVSLVAMPVFHIGGSGWGVMGLYHGAKGVIAREFDPNKVLDFFEQSGITKLFMVPAAMQFVVRQPRAREVDFSRLKYMLYGASPIPAALLKECIEVFGCGFVQMYGMTETTGTIVALPPEDHVEGLDRMRRPARPCPGSSSRSSTPTATAAAGRSRRDRHPLRLQHGRLLESAGGHRADARRRRLAAHRRRRLPWTRTAISSSTIGSRT